MFSDTARYGIRIARYLAYLVLGLGWVIAKERVDGAFLDWEVLGVWFAPVVCILYAPLVLQAGIVCLLQS
jgi:GPI-anchor transamidase subunit GAA1